MTEYSDRARKVAADIVRNTVDPELDFVRSLIIESDVLEQLVLTDDAIEVQRDLAIEVIELLAETISHLTKMLGESRP